MLTFTCKAYENITFFTEVGLRLLALMGHSGTVPGALKANEVPAALANLQKAIAGEKDPGSAAEGYHGYSDKEPAIPVATRAVPLINLLSAAVKENCDVLWK